MSSSSESGIVERSRVDLQDAWEVGDGCAEVMGTAHIGGIEGGVLHRSSDGRLVRYRRFRDPLPDSGETAP